MADGIRQTITDLSNIIGLYIENKVNSTEFRVFPEAKGNKIPLERDSLNAARIILYIEGRKWYFSENPRKQFEFFKKLLENIIIIAFGIREEEVNHIPTDKSKKPLKIVDHTH
ncbi:hypothetical protein NPIL_533341 [Nephila pilipes]|uniref:Uncharacterized protein n=1 Tax=Nephila pilipes TaxID=299642 RepID=A0A8X6PGG6_NEPPI|nr:hypothetical protein NPIL_533341 [Nephila pilipes]